jgi:hypothetical protein
MRIKKSEAQQFTRKQLFVRNAMPDGWLEYADELKDTAEVLWQQREDSMRLEADLTLDGFPVQDAKYIGYSRPYILLSGFALENLIKGLLVAKNPTLVSSGTLNRDLKSHNLVTLASMVNWIKLTKKEMSVLKIAQEALPYWGRYPIPLNLNEIRKEVPLNADYRDTFVKMYDRLSKQLHDTIKDGWDSGVGPRLIRIRNVKRGDIIDRNEPFF